MPEALLEELRQLAPPLDFQEAQDAPGRRGTRNYHLKAHWRAYVPYMAVVNRRLESLGVKMYCPFPLRPSFVPRSIDLDSQGLLDVLVQSNDQALLLKGIVEEDFGQGLPGVRGKNDFNKSVTKLVAPGEQVVGSSAPGRLRTCVWRGLTTVPTSGTRPPRQASDCGFRVRLNPKTAQTHPQACAYDVYAREEHIQRVL